MENPDKFFYGNREFKVLFRGSQCKFSMYENVAKLPCGKVTVTKLPCGEVTGNRLITVTTVYPLLLTVEPLSVLSVRNKSLS